MFCVAFLLQSLLVIGFFYHYFEPFDYISSCLMLAEEAE